MARALDHADFAAPTRQHEPDHTDHADHTDQTGEGSICRQGPRSSSGNRLSVKGVKTMHGETVKTAEELEGIPSSRERKGGEMVGIALSNQVPSQFFGLIRKPVY